MCVFIRLIYFNIQLHPKMFVLLLVLGDAVSFIVFLTACPPLHGSVVIAGLAIMAIAHLLSLAYVFIMGK